MSTFEGVFLPTIVVAADDHARIALDRIGVCEGDRYAVSTNAGGEILLTPLVKRSRDETLALMARTREKTRGTVGVDEEIRQLRDET